MKTGVAIVGGGPAGSTAALQLARLGIDSVIVERASFPRFHIGESLTGAAGKRLRQLGLESEMDAAQFPVKHGTYVYGPEGKSGFYVPVVDELPDGSRENATTWQVRRSVFDDLVLQQALEAGAGLVAGTATEPLVDGADAVSGLRVTTDAGEESIEADFVIDASGQGCFLAKQGLTSEKRRGAYDKQIALFTHVAGASRGTEDNRDDTVILYREPDHWSWFIPIDGETVSVGVVVPARLFRASGASPEDFLRDEFRTLNPELAWRVEDAEMVIEPQLISNYSYTIEDYVGPGWLCAGDSHQFVDPVFSFGVHFAVHEGARSADTVAAYLDGGRDLEVLRAHQAWADGGQEVIRDLLDAFWGMPLAFGYLVHNKHFDDMVDLFAGRVYDIDEPSDGLTAMRKLTAKVRANRTAQELEAVAPGA